MIAQPLKTRADVIELFDFVQDRFKEHERTALLQDNLRWGELQMDWLRTEDLKEEKVVTTSLPIVAVTKNFDPNRSEHAADFSKSWGYA